MMNRCKEGGDGFHVPRTRRVAVSNYFKDKEEELSFFQDLQRRDKGDQIASLLQPIVSEEFEANGNYVVEASAGGGRKGIGGLEFLGESGKNDYNWLKTPPATPLFPSLEMEAKGPGLGLVPELPLQREIPITHPPLSRFAAGNSDGSKTTTSSSSANYAKPNLPQQHKTPKTSDKRNLKTAPVITTQTTPALANKTKPNIPSLSKSIAPTEPGRAKTRGVSPSLRPTIPSLAGFSDKTLPNSKTTSNRPASATRGRPTNPNFSTTQIKDNSNSKTIRRQSCSPSMARGRKVDTSTSTGADGNKQHGQVLGSRMVERFMNARVSHEERESRTKTTHTSLNYEGSSGGERPVLSSKIKLNGSSLNESSGFGRLISRNSLDMARKHMEVRQHSSNPHKNPIGPARKY